LLYKGLSSGKCPLYWLLVIICEVLTLGMANNTNQKINALLDALNSDEDIGLIIQALGDPVREMRDTAYWLLTEIKNEADKQALRLYPYVQMQLLHLIYTQVD
jgi:hypothetical protein